MDNHPPQRAVLPPGTPPVGTQDPPTRHTGDSDSLPTPACVFGVLSRLFLDSELMAETPSSGNRERPSGLKLRLPLVLPVYQAGSALS